MNSKSKEEALNKLANFSKSANKTAVHECDWERFYDFMLEVFKSNVGISAEDVDSYLKKDGWLEDDANDVALKFEWGLALLEYFERNKCSIRALINRIKNITNLNK